MRSGPESFRMTDARTESDHRADAAVAPEARREAASRALAARRYRVLAALAAGSMTAPTVLDTSVPLRAVGGGSGLVVTVTFAPASCEFVAATAEDREVQEVFRGPSLTLACSAANQALEGLAPLTGAPRPPRHARYSREGRAIDREKAPKRRSRRT